jgi:hypothetical protein
LPFILENADFRPPTHVSSGCQWSVASSVGQRPKSPIPVPRFPIWPEIGEGIPVSRFGQNRETGIPRFPILAESGNGVPMAAGRGLSGLVAGWEGSGRAVRPLGPPPRCSSNSQQRYSEVPQSGWHQPGSDNSNGADAALRECRLGWQWRLWRRPCLQSIRFAQAAARFRIGARTAPLASRVPTSRRSRR